MVAFSSVAGKMDRLLTLAQNLGEFVRQSVQRSRPFFAQRKASRASSDGRGDEKRIGELGVWPSTVGYGDEVVENGFRGHFQLQPPQQLAEATFSRLSPALNLGDDVGKRECLQVHA
jgi:hypothetical protein